MSLRRTLFLSGMVLTAVLASIYYLYPSPVEYLTLKATDLVSRSGSDRPVQVKVVTVAIDDKSLEKYGQWPWPRHRLASLLEMIRDAGASSIGVDILMPEQERYNHRLLGQEQAGSTTSLAATLADGPFVLGYSFLFDNEQAVGGECMMHPVFPLRVGRKGVSIPYNDFHEASGVICNHESLMESVHSTGFLNGSPDSDGLLRRLPLLIEFEEKLFLSFPLAVVQQAQPFGKLILSRDSSNVTTLTVGKSVIATDNSGNFLLDRMQETRRPYSAASVLDGEVNADIFKDAIVLVGMTGAGLSQHFATPFSPTTPALEVYRQAVESLLAGGNSIRTSDFILFEMVASVVVCTGLILAVIYLPIPVAVVFAMAVVGIGWIMTGWFFDQSGYLFSPLFPTVAITLNTFLLLTLKYRHFQNEARQEKDQVLEKLHVREKDLASILQTVPDIIYRLDSAGRITFISPAVEQYGVTIKSLLGKSIFDLVASTDINQAKYGLNERRCGERSTSDLEVRLRLAKGREASGRELSWFRVSAQGIYEKNSKGERVFHGTQGIMHDITEHRQLEQQLLKAQKLEVIGNLAARVAHDLNNILAGLVSYPDLLLHEIPEDDPMHGKIAIIRKSGKKAAVIVQDLLTLARRNVQETESCRIDRIISEYLESIECRSLLETFPEITITKELPENLMPVLGSEVHLSKAVMNVVTNAVEAMPEGGSIQISAANTYVDAAIEGFERIPEGEYVKVTVADSGVGIAAEELQRIFEPFYTRKSGNVTGTGLGMTIIWATVKDRDGYIDVHSREGEGTTIELYLRASRTGDIATSRQERLSDYSGSGTILIVDDVPDQLEIAKTMLTRLGYRVLTAESGEQALRVIKKQPVDLLLLDMIMPGGLDGLETYREILAIRPDQKAVAMSGSFDAERTLGLRELGVNSFLEKPFTLAKLGRVVREEMTAP